MRAAFLLITLAPLTSVGAQTAKVAKPCTTKAELAGCAEPVRARPLGDMPPAKQIYTVYRERNGCTELAVVREQVGAPARR